ncbi:MAG: hypothetical protein HQ568_00280 [Calditrichaeota bacterium]|nr:hypothetical protein [Calditrichota bacterium]
MTQRQRYSKADDILEIEPPDLVSYSQQKRNQESDNSYYKCIKTRNSFYINPYGKMSFCPYVRDNQFCFDLRQGSFSEGWDEFIPSLIEMLKPGTEYRDGCGSCEYFTDCNWCPVYAYLEHGNHESKIKYLCAITNEKMELRKKRKHEHQRLFQIGGMTILVDSDLPIKDTTFDAKFKLFQIDETDTNLITIRHRFEQPSDLDLNSDEVLYDRIPWRIYRRRNNFIYTLNSTPDNKGKPKLIAETNLDHTYTTIYHNDENKRLFQKGNIPSLSTFTSDQIILSRVLADRNGCYIHAAGVILDGQGLLFPGVKEAGKTTISNLLKEHAEVLCDDRIIMRNVSELPYIYGTWSHGDLTDVSPSSTPLRAILFLKKSNDNRLVKINDNGEVLKNILPLIIRPLISDEWWQKVLQVIEEVIITVPAYYLYFDQSSGVVELLRESFGKEA